MDALESCTRLDNLIFKGLPEQSFAERGTPAATDTDSAAIADSHLAVEQTVIAFCRDSLHIDVDKRDISTAHRLKAGPKDSIRPVIVRFTNRRIRDAVFRAKKQLKTLPKPVYISEHLTKLSADIFYESRKLVRNKKLHSTWSQNGQIYIKVTSDPASRPKLIKSRAELSIYG